MSERRKEKMNYALVKPVKKTLFEEASIARDQIHREVASTLFGTSASQAE